MTPEQIRVTTYFRGNDHINICLYGQTQDALSHFCDLVLKCHEAGLDWYTTGGTSNTARCGRKNIHDLQARDQLIRVAFTRTSIRVVWKAANEAIAWDEAQRCRALLPLSEADFSSLDDCIAYLADQHKIKPPREGFWPYHYNKLEVDRQLDGAIQRSLKLSESYLLKCANEGPEYPTTRVVETVVYNRNPAVVAVTLRRADGKCQACGKEAPFNRRIDNKPYLEVHHRTPLAQGGRDRLDNAVALCPNCHREQHFGASPSPLQ